MGIQALSKLILEHTIIVAAASLIGVAVGIGLGVVAYWAQYVGKVILWIVDMIQTIPSLALLAILMIFFGLGNTTLVLGLVLYSLLPIVRNTYIGLSTISPHIKDAARGMGMSRVQRLWRVELPISFPLIFSGIKIAVVTSLSIAVIGVLIGAGGLGYPIYRGIQSRNIQLILTGAVPVVALAVLFDWVMSSIEKRLVKRAV